MPTPPALTTKKLTFPTQPGQRFLIQIYCFSFCSFPPACSSIYGNKNCVLNHRNTPRVVPRCGPGPGEKRFHINLFLARDRHRQEAGAGRRRVRDDEDEYRYYAPRLGRWVSRDPIEEDGAINLMRFCNNGLVIWSLGQCGRKPCTWCVRADPASRFGGRYRWHSQRKFGSFAKNTGTAPDTRAQFRGRARHQCKI